MTDWKRGGWTGSLNRWVQKEINDHFRDNAVARRTRYPLLIRVLHRVFDGATFWHFVWMYFALVAAAGLGEVMAARYLPSWLPQWTSQAEIKSLLTNVASYLITAQVGVLGVISIAIGLVTIIAQRDNASTEIQIYYHESLAFEIVASSVALLAVLCAQLLWPIHFGIHQLGLGTSLQVFKIGLTGAHLLWLLINLSGLAHFVATTFAFVQQKAREGLREQYTTNVILPVEMRKRLRQQLFLSAGPDFAREFWPTDTSGHSGPTIYLGNHFSAAGDIEVVLKPRKGAALYDVRMCWLQWVVKRWLKRCAEATELPPQTRGLGNDLLLLFPPQLDSGAEVALGLCRRRGGVPLTPFERWIVKRAFKFRRNRHET